MPPERDDQEHQDDSAVSRSYYEDRYKSKDPSSSDSHRRQDSAFWDSYGYGLRDNYGYGSQDQGYDYSYPSERIGSGYSNPCSRQAQVPGYRQALQDPSFALGLFVMGALATYVLYGAITTAGIGKKKRNLAGNVLDNFWSGKISIE